MSIFDGLMNMMRVNDEEDDDEYYEDEAEEIEESRPRLNILRRKENAAPAEEEEDSKPRLFTRKVTPVRKPGALELALVKPRSFDESKEIVDDLLNGKAVVLNMEGLSTDIAQRIIDFTSGATYSMNGKLQKIANCIFIITPENVSLSGEFQDILNGVAAPENTLNVRF